MLNLKTLGTLERERERESLTLENTSKAYLLYSENTFQKINKRKIKIEML